MCMYVAHWNIFMVNKRDLLKKYIKKKCCAFSFILDTEWPEDHKYAYNCNKANDNLSISLSKAIFSLTSMDKSYSDRNMSKFRCDNIKEYSNIFICKAKHA